MVKQYRLAPIVLLIMVFLLLQGFLVFPDHGLPESQQNSITKNVFPGVSPVPDITVTPTQISLDTRKILKGFLGSWLNYHTIPLMGGEPVGQYTGMQMQIDAEAFSVAGMVCHDPEYSIKQVTPDEFFQGYERPDDRNGFFTEKFTVLETGCENFEPAYVALVDYNSLGFILEDELLLFEADMSVTENGVTIESDIMVEYSEDPFYEIRAQIPLIREPEMTEYNGRVRAVADEAIQPFKTDLESRDVPDEMASYRSFMWIGYDVSYLSAELVSIRYHMDFYYAGAAHPGHYFRVVNYDLKAGREIQFDDLFTDNEKALTFLSGYCKKKLETLDFLLFEEGLLPKKENFSNWNLTPRGIRLSFDPYQVVPYAAGPQEILVPYAQLGDYLNPESPVGAILAH